MISKNIGNKKLAGNEMKNQTYTKVGGPLVGALCLFTFSYLYAIAKGD